MSYDHARLTHSSQTAPIKEYRVMWTAQKKQKLKKWHDGTLRFHTFNNRMLLYDETRSLVTDKYLKPGTRIDEGDELEFEQHLATVEEFLQTVIQDLAPVFAPAIQRAQERASTAFQNGMSPVRVPAQRMGAQPQGPTSRSAPPTASGGGPRQYIQTPLRQQQRPQTPQTPRTRPQVEMGPPPPQWRQGQPPAWPPAPVHRTSAPLPPPGLPPQWRNVGPPVRNQPSRPPQAPVSRPPPLPPPPAHIPELQVRASPESESPPRPKPPSCPQSPPAQARQLRPPQSRPPPHQAPPQPAALPQQQQGPPPGLQGAPQPRQHPQPPQPLPLQFAGLPPPPSRQRPAQAQPPPPQTTLVHASGRAQPANLSLEANSDPDLGKPRTPEPGILRLSDPHRKRRKLIAPLPPRMTPPQEVTQRPSPPSRTTPQHPPPARPQPVLQPPREQEQEQGQYLLDKPPPQPQPPRRKQLPPGQKPTLPDSLLSASPPPPEPWPRPQSKPTPKPQWRPPAQQSEPRPKRARITTTTTRISIDSGSDSDSDPFSPMAATPAATEAHEKKQPPPGERPQKRGKTLAERQAERKDYDDAGPWSREAASLFEWTPW